MTNPHAALVHKAKTLRASLGAPSGPPAEVGDGRGWKLDLQRATIYWTEQTDAHEVHGSIRKRWDELGGPKWRGYPTTDERKTPDGKGRYNHFERGSIYWTPQLGAHEVYGAIREKWKALGWERSFLGYPKTGERAAPDGKGRYNHFQGGSIYWTKQTGAHEVHGAIREKWKSLGWERSFLGYPKTDETATPDTKGRYNHFEGGSIYWTQQTGAHEVHGAIREKWKALGWERSFLGYPKTDERKTPDGKGRYNHFQRGSIYWTKQTGAHEVHGAIREKWKSLGWERSFLGYPKTDETPTRDDKGRYSHFQGGSIFWSKPTGAHEVHGAIRGRWAKLGWALSPLGFPTSDEQRAPGGGRMSEFQHGRIYWKRGLGAHAVMGEILAAWLQREGPAGALGYPIGPEADDPQRAGHRVQPFEKGKLVRTPSGQVEEERSTAEPTTTEPVEVQRVQTGDTLEVEWTAIGGGLELTYTQLVSELDETVWPFFLSSLLVGKPYGEELTAEVTPEDAFGPDQPSDALEVAWDTEAEEWTPAIGDPLMLEGDDRLYFCVEIGESVIRIDTRHPLQGMAVEVRLVANPVADVEGG